MRMHTTNFRNCCFLITLSVILCKIIFRKVIKNIIFPFFGTFLKTTIQLILLKTETNGSSSFFSHLLQPSFFIVGIASLVL